MEEFAFQLMDYIFEKAFILIPVLLIIGKLMKGTPEWPDWCIPWVLTAIGVLLSVMMLGLHVDAVIQGVLVAGVTVYGNQLWKQTTERG